MTPLGKVFWTIAGIDAVLLAVFFLMTLHQPAGHNDGGREMGLFFFILLPAVVLVLAMLMFRFVPWLPMKWLALFIVLVPGLWFAKAGIESAIVDRQVEADRQGVGYFDSEPMRRMGAAVVQRDLETLRRVGPSVDVNAAGRDMTLLRLAVDNADPRHSDGSELPVVRTLLALGAKADAAMEIACVREDPQLLELLLGAGGNPNLKVGEREPLVFETKSSITPGNFRMLAAHGLDLDVRSRDEPLVVQLAIYRRWDLLAIAIELGADTGRARPDGRNVADELAGQVAEEEQAGHDVPADLLRARALLASSRKPQ